MQPFLLIFLLFPFLKSSLLTLFHSLYIIIPLPFNLYYTPFRPFSIHTLSSTFLSPLFPSPLSFPFPLFSYVIPPPLNPYFLFLAPLLSLCPFPSPHSTPHCTAPFPSLLGRSLPALDSCSSVPPCPVQHITIKASSSHCYWSSVEC